MPDEDVPTLPLFAEVANVQRRKRVTGKLRIQVTPSSREDLIEVVLKDERIAVEHIPVERFVDEVPVVRVEGNTTIIPVLEERAVVTVRLFLREELHVHTVQTTRTEQRAIDLRKETVTVHRDAVGDQEITEGESQHE